MKELRTKKYAFCFDVWGLGLFLLIMLPNMIWFAVPAPEDILRRDSATPMLDAAASVSQACMVAALCFLQNRRRRKSTAPFAALTAACCLLYYVSWVAYYLGIAHAGALLGLTFLPCLSFLFFALGRENWLAVVPTVVFTMCHGAHGVLNFLL